MKSHGHTRKAMSHVYTGGRYLHDSRILAEGERIKALKCPDRVYKREFERFAGAYFFTNTHVMVVIVKQNVWSTCAEWNLISTRAGSLKEKSYAANLRGSRE